MSRKAASTNTAKDSPEALTNPTDQPVLIVDDDPDMLLSMRLLLERKGFQVETRMSCPNWTELQHLKPFLVFMDINLGTENGIVACTAIKHNPRFHHLPVILISGWDGERLADAADQCHADGFLSKPYGANLLIDLARHYAQRAAAMN
jgi:CheY-like chemotaxis protein